MIKKFVFVFCLLVLWPYGYSKHLKLCAEAWPPYDYMAHGKAVGTDVELNKNILNSMGLTGTQVLIMPWDKCWQLVSQGKIDGALMVSKKKFREKSVYYPDKPLTKANFVWVRNEHYRAKYFDACPNLSKENIKIGIVKGNSYNSAFIQCLQKPENKNNIESYSTLEDSIRMLILNKVQLILAIPEIVELYNNTLKIGKVYIRKTPLFTKVYYTVFSKKSKFTDPKYKNIQSVLAAYNSAVKDYKENANQG